MERTTIKRHLPPPMAKTLGTDPEHLRLRLLSKQEGLHSRLEAFFPEHFPLKFF